MLDGQLTCREPDCTMFGRPWEPPVPRPECEPAKAGPATAEANSSSAGGKKATRTKTKNTEEAKGSKKKKPRVTTHRAIDYGPPMEPVKQWAGKPAAEAAKPKDAATSSGEAPAQAPSAAGHSWDLAAPHTVRVGVSIPDVPVEPPAAKRQSTEEWMKENGPIITYVGGGVIDFPIG